MKASLVLCVAAALVGAARAECTACIDSMCYRKHHLPGVSGDTLDIDRKKNILYSTDGLTLTKCNLGTTRCNNIPDTRDVNSFTVDQSTSSTYGRINGEILKFNIVTDKKASLIGSGGNYVTFNDKLYISAFPGDGMFTYENEQPKAVPGTEGYHIDNFIVDANHDIYFNANINNKHVILLKRLSKGLVNETEYWDDSYWITVDKHGNAVFIDQESHAVFRVTDYQLVEVGAIDDSIQNNWYYSPLFDRDNNIIYKNNQGYFHLKRENGVNCTMSIVENKRIITEIVATPKKSSANIPFSLNTLIKATTTTSSPSVEPSFSSENTEDHDDIYHGTPQSTTSSSHDETCGANPPGAPEQQPLPTGYEKQSSCNSGCPMLPKTKTTTTTTTTSNTSTTTSTTYHYLV